MRGRAGLRLEGLMVLPPLLEDVEGVRPYFRRLRALRDRALDEGLLAVGELSMGMSHDFEAAVEEGATLVRVGTAIFGERSPDAGLCSMTWRFTRNLKNERTALTFFFMVLA